MAESKYVVQITGDITDLQRKLAEAQGSAKRLSDKEVVITLEYDGNVKGFNKKFEEIAKQHPELTIQFQYDINKRQLAKETQKLQQLEAIKVDVETGAATKKLKNMMSILKEDAKSGMSTGALQSRVEDIYKYADAVEKAGKKIDRVQIGNDLYDALDGIDLSKNIDDLYDAFVDKSKKLSHLSLTGSIDEEIAETRKMVDEFSDYMNHLKLNGAMDDGVSGDMKELQDQIKIINSEISIMQDSLNNLSGEAFIDMQKKIDIMNQSLRDTIGLVHEIGGADVDNVARMANEISNKTANTGNEHAFGYNSKTKRVGTDVASGTSFGITFKEILKSTYAEIDSFLHTHPRNYAALSDDDVEHAFEMLQEGIKNQTVQAFNEVMTIDFSKVNTNMKDNILKEIRGRYDEIEQKAMQESIDPRILQDIVELTPKYIQKQIDQASGNAKKVLENIFEKAPDALGKLDNDATFEDVSDVINDLMDSEMTLFATNVKKQHEEIKKQYSEGKISLEDAESKRAMVSKDFQDLMENVANGVDSVFQSMNSHIQDQLQVKFQSVLMDVFNNPSFLKNGETSAIKLEAYSDFIDWGTIVKSAEEAGEKASEALRKTQQSNSPSKVTEELGKDFGDGYAKGIDESVDKVIAAVENLAAEALKAAGNSIIDEETKNKLQEQINTLAVDMKALFDTNPIHTWSQEYLEVLHKVLSELNNVAKNDALADMLDAWAEADILDNKAHKGNDDHKTHERAAIILDDGTIIGGYNIGTTSSIGSGTRMQKISASEGKNILADIHSHPDTYFTRMSGINTHYKTDMDTEEVLSESVSGDLFAWIHDWIDNGVKYGVINSLKQVNVFDTEAFMKSYGEIFTSYEEEFRELIAKKKKEIKISSEENTEFTKNLEGIGVDVKSFYKTLIRSFFDKALPDDLLDSLVDKLYKTNDINGLSQDPSMYLSHIKTQSFLALKHNNLNAQDYGFVTDRYSDKSESDLRTGLFRIMGIDPGNNVDQEWNYLVKGISDYSLRMQKAIYEASVELNKLYDTPIIEDIFENNQVLSHEEFREQNPLGLPTEQLEKLSSLGNDTGIEKLISELQELVTVLSKLSESGQIKLDFNQDDLSKIADGIREILQLSSSAGITTSIDTENEGFQELLGTIQKISDALENFIKLMGNLDDKSFMSITDAFETLVFSINKVQDEVGRSGLYGGADVSNLENALANIVRLFGEIDENTSFKSIIDAIDLLIKKLDEIVSRVDVGKEQLDQVEKVSAALREQADAIDKVNKEFDEQKAKEATGGIDTHTEADSLNPLKNALLEVIDLVDKKTDAFLTEEELVAAVVNGEESSLNRLMGSLELICNVLKDISELTKGQHNGLANGLDKLLQSVSRDDFGEIKDKLFKFKDGLKELRDDLADMTLPEDNFISKIEKLMADKEALQNMANIAKNAQKIENATKTSSTEKKAKEYTDEDVAKAKLKLEDKIRQYTSWRDVLEAKGEGYDGTQNILNDLDKIIERLKEMSEIADKTNLDKVGKSIHEATQQQKELNNAFQTMISGDSPIGSEKISAEMNSLAQFMQKNSGASKEWKESLEACYLKLEKMAKAGGAMASEFNPLKAQIKDIEAEMRRASETGISMWDRMKRSLKAQIAQQAAMYLSLQDFIRYARNLVNAVTEVDTALTELRKVSDATDTRLAQSFKTSSETAKELGRSITEVINSTADWARMGYNVDEAEELARVTTLYQNVGDNIDQQTASENMISALQGFQLTAEDAESVIDKFNEVANNYAIDAQGIGEALKRSAASFNAAGTDISKATALVTATK